VTDRTSWALGRRRLFGPASCVAAALVLLAGSVLPDMVPPGSNGRPATPLAATVQTLPAELPPASVSQVPKQGSATARLGLASSGPVSADGRVRQVLFESSTWSVPNVLLYAYCRAVARAPAKCHLPVSLLAAFGQVESGSLAGRSIDASHRAVPPVLGPVLDGLGTAAIRDTDGGRLDGNRLWDRAVGPMQFIPGTWAAFGVDADGDGRADPQDVYDSAAAAAGYLCAYGRDLALASGLRSAILAYNHSTPHLATVLAWQHRFARRASPPRVGLSDSSCRGIAAAMSA
jgi:Transglycosylase SLT domain